MTPTDLRDKYQPELDRFMKKFKRLKLNSDKHYKAENVLRLLGEANLFLIAQAASAVHDQAKVNVAFTLSEFCAAYARQIILREFPQRERPAIILRG